jgi:hypothetical protein
MSSRATSHLLLGVPLAVALVASACNGRNVIGEQTGNAGSDGGIGGAGGTGSPACPPGYSFRSADGSFMCVPDGVGGTTGLGGFGVAGTTGSAGTTGAGGFGEAGTTGFGGFGEAGTTGSAGTTGAGGDSAITCGAPGGTGGGFAFLPPLQHPNPRGPFAVAVADLNGDGKPDFATANREAQDVLGGAGGDSGAGGAAGSDFAAGGSLSVLLSDATSGYRPPRHYLESTHPRSVATGDLNGDGTVDLAVPRDEAVSLLFNSASGVLSSPVTFSTSPTPSVAVGDINGDGRLDFVVANPSYRDGAGGSLTGDVGVYLNMGVGSFVATNYAAGPRPWAAVLAGLTNRARPDLAVASGPGVSVSLNAWNGGFETPKSYGVGTNPLSIAASDLNADTKTDLVVSGGTGTNVMLNLGDGTFTAAINYGVGVGSVVIGDLNGDGRPDLAGAVSWPCPLVVILPNTGNGTFGQPVYVGTGAEHAGGLVSISIALHDMNGDGRLDLVVPNRDGVGVLLNASP